MLSLRDIARAARFMAEVQHKQRKAAPGVEQALSTQLIALRNETKEINSCSANSNSFTDSRELSSQVVASQPIH